MPRMSKFMLARYSMTKPLYFQYVWGQLAPIAPLPPFNRHLHRGLRQDSLQIGDRRWQWGLWGCCCWGRGRRHSHLRGHSLVSDSLGLKMHLKLI